MKHIIQNQDSYFVEGGVFHNVWTFDKNEAGRFTEFEASLKTVRMVNWRNEEREIIEL